MTKIKPEISQNTKNHSKHYKRGRHPNSKKNLNHGRPPGMKNKFTTLKDAFLKAFQELGGVKGLVDWARKNARNQAHFYQMITKMLPSNVDISGQVDIRYEISEDYKPKGIPLKKSQNSQKELQS